MHAAADWQPNYVKACVSTTAIGLGATGSSCTQPRDCRSAMCDATFGQCTDICSRDTDCPITHVCGVTAWQMLSGGPQIWANVCKPRNG